jgi:hypothetical protein
MSSTIRSLGLLTVLMAAFSLAPASMSNAQTPPPSGTRSPAGAPGSPPSGASGQPVPPSAAGPAVVYPKAPPYRGRPAYNRQGGGSEIGAFGAGQASHREDTDKS